MRNTSKLLDTITERLTHAAVTIDGPEGEARRHEGAGGTGSAGRVGRAADAIWMEMVRTE